MPTYSLPIGEKTAMAQNVVFALPNGLCYVSSNAAVESSADGTTWAALTGANTVGVLCGNMFLRCTGAGGANVIVKSYK